MSYSARMYLDIFHVGNSSPMEGSCLTARLAVTTVSGRHCSRAQVLHFILTSLFIIF